MNSKTVISAVLLLFIAASIIYLVAKDTGEKPKPDSARTEMAFPQTEPSQDTKASPSSKDAKAAARVVVYYFHGNARCMTCRNLEAYTKEAIESGFADAIKDGRLEWRVVNFDTTGNEHFIRDFNLPSLSVVLERTVNGKRQEWKNLQRIWDLIRGDKGDFLKYIQDETRAYLEWTGK